MTAPPELLTSLLRDVSRSFYLTLRVLPAAIRPQIGLAYLLARTTDTIADTNLVPVAQRLAALAQLRARILGEAATRLDFQAFIGPGSAPDSAPMDAERTLLARVEEALTLLDTCTTEDRQLIREVLDTITTGQELDLQRFGSSTGGAITALQTDQELDEYTYRVAGCVGEFWTKICRAHVLSGLRLDDRWLLERGVRFGKGLQLVNIMRDLPADLQQGRCYLPAAELARLGLAPLDLTTAAGEVRLRPLYDRLLDRAAGHLMAGWEYTNALPWRCARVRLACAWPILIGAETLERLRGRAVLDPAKRIKIRRSDVKRILAMSVLLYPLPPLWRKLCRLPRQAVVRAWA